MTGSGLLELIHNWMNCDQTEGSQNCYNELDSLSDVNRNFVRPDM